MKYADTIQSFDFALITQAAANAQYLHTSKVLQLIPGVSSGPFGTTPDHIKASPEYKKAKSEYESAFQGSSRDQFRVNIQVQETIHGPHPGKT